MEVQSLFFNMEYAKISTDHLKIFPSNNIKKKSPQYITNINKYSADIFKHIQFFHLIWLDTPSNPFDGW